MARSKNDQLLDSIVEQIVNCLNTFEDQLVVLWNILDEVDVLRDEMEDQEQLKKDRQAYLDKVNDIQKALDSLSSSGISQQSIVRSVLKDRIAHEQSKADRICIRV